MLGLTPQTEHIWYYDTVGSSPTKSLMSRLVKAIKQLLCWHLVWCCVPFTHTDVYKYSGCRVYECQRCGKRIIRSSEQAPISFIGK